MVQAASSDDTLPFLNPYEEISIHRRRLPHWQQIGKMYFVTWHLADSLPQDLLQRWVDERTIWLKLHPLPWKAATHIEYKERFGKVFDDWLDMGSGACVLKDAVCREILAQAFFHFDGVRYDLDAFVIMPNHVHILFRIADDQRLEDVLHSWKSYTANLINRLNQTRGTLWQAEYWDRLIRDEKHLRACREYIARNPSHAKLPEGAYTLWMKSTNSEGIGRERRAGMPTLQE
jgi:REP element-mobilizing transposase RayT